MFSSFYYFRLVVSLGWLLFLVSEPDFEMVSVASMMVKHIFLIWQRSGHLYFWRVYDGRMDYEWRGVVSNVFGE